VTRALAVLVVVAAAHRAYAYPQFQLSKDPTCSGCHISPSGGGLLNENGMNTAEAISQYGTNPDFMYGKLGLPSWLMLGGDLRGAGGYLRTPQTYPFLIIPMQADVYASAVWNQFRLYVTGGYRPIPYDVTRAPVWSREHYLMFHDDPSVNDGLYIRVGRFMPVFGLRLAEHTTYIRRFGGTQLYAETYGAAVDYVQSGYEAHVTGFIKDPLIDPVEHSSGVAALGEYRIDDTTQIGAEAMFAVSVDDKTVRGGLLAKHYLKKPDVLLQGELQLVDQMIANGNANGSTASAFQIVGYALGSWFPAQAFMVDVGVGYFNSNVNVHGVYRNAFDVNVHWFTTSHLETVLITRYEPNDIRTVDDTGAYAMLMLHYRL
jgi:hypothetical protein